MKSVGSIGLILCEWYSEGYNCSHSCSIHFSFAGTGTILASKCYCGVFSAIPQRWTGMTWYLCLIWVVIQGLQNLCSHHTGRIIQRLSRLHWVSFSNTRCMTTMGLLSRVISILLVMALYEGCLHSFNQFVCPAVSSMLVRCALMSNQQQLHVLEGQKWTQKVGFPFLRGKVHGFKLQYAMNM